MNYFNIRLIIKKESLEIVKKDNEKFSDVLSKAEINKSFDNLAYIGWKELNSELFYILLENIYELKDKNISYRMTTIGEELQDIYEYYYTSTEDEVDNIPFPSIVRDFDEKDMIQQLKAYEKYQKMLVEKDIIEYD